MKTMYLVTALSLLVTGTVAAQNAQSQSKKDVATLNKNSKQGQSEVNADKHTEKATNKEKKEETKALRKLEGKTVNSQVKQAFNRDFGNLPVKTWERTAYFDEAMFSKDGALMKAYYDSEAHLVGTTVHKKFSDLPAKSQKYINDKYKGYSKSDVILFDDNETNGSDMILYGHQFEDADNYFVPLTKDNHTIILQVNMHGDVTVFKRM